MNNLPLVSVLTTAYNRANYITEAIDSVLSSTYPNFELIIVDDCSSDNTFQIIEEFAGRDERVKGFRNEVNLGDYKNRNKAASFAKGKYIKYLDSDDIMYPHCLEVMVYCMEKFPSAGFGLCSMADVDKPLPTLSNPYNSYKEHFGEYGHFNRAPGSSIIQLNAFNKIGGFSGKRWIGDMELWFKMGKKFDLVKIPTGLYWDRHHDNKESKTEETEANKILSQQMKKTLLEEMLTATDCPLLPEEIIAVKSAYKKQNLKIKLRSLITKF